MGARMWATSRETRAMDRGTVPVRAAESATQSRPRYGNRALAVALRGTAGASESLPYLETLQRAFAGHDLSTIRSRTGGAAREACAELGARAYAAGEQVGFATTPRLHDVAHETAHVLQQRAGVRPAGGVGVAGDVHERHADAVADRVSAGGSAAGLLAGVGGSTASAGVGASVQLLQAEYDFSNAVLEDVKDRDVYRITVNGEVVYAKRAGFNELLFNTLARTTGLNCPETRALTALEREALGQRDVPVNQGWIVMDQVSGHDFFQRGRGAHEEFNEAQMVEIGKTVAFQVFMKGVDRWDMPMGMAKGHSNLENLMVDDDGRIALIDNTANSQAGSVEAWKREIDEHVQTLLTSVGESEMLERVLALLRQGQFAPSEGDRKHIRRGFVEFMQQVQNIDLEGLRAMSQRGDEFVDFWQAMQLYFAEKLEVIAPVENQRGLLRGHIQRYKQSRKLGSTRKRTKQRIKKMRKQLPRGERGAFDEMAREELVSAFGR